MFYDEFMYTMTIDLSLKFKSKLNIFYDEFTYTIKYPKSIIFNDEFEVNKNL